MIRFSACTVLIILFISTIESTLVEGSQSVLQRTMELLFTERSQKSYLGTCNMFRSSVRQKKMCKRDPDFAIILTKAQEQAINACEESFKYDRWNCSLVFNIKKSKRKIFSKVYRETAFIHALMAASITQAVAKGCASGRLSKCSCVVRYSQNSTSQWKRNGCDDDFKYGKRITRKFLDFKHAGSDQIAEVLKQDISIGIDSIGEQMREVCKCHGFSGSCTMKTCWKRLGSLNSAMGSLKKHYHHAVRVKITNYTTKTAVAPNVRKKNNINKKQMVYFHKTPNLCISTKGRICRDANNCATLCCGRGYVTSKMNVSSRCRCKMVKCCSVKCDTCTKLVNYYTCK